MPILFSRNPKKVIPEPTQELEEARHEQNLARAAMLKEQTTQKVADLLLQIQSIYPCETDIEAKDQIKTQKFFKILDQFAQLDPAHIHSTFEGDVAIKILMAGNPKTEPSNKIYYVYGLLNANLTEGVPTAAKVKPFRHEGLSTMLRQMVKRQEINSSEEESTRPNVRSLKL